MDITEVEYWDALNTVAAQALADAVLRQVRHDMSSVPIMAFMAAIESTHRDQLGTQRTIMFLMYDQHRMKRHVGAPYLGSSADLLDRATAHTERILNEYFAA